MEGRDFLATAKSLAIPGLQEPDWRSAISRAYYAAFLEARSVLENYMEIEVKKKDAHQDVQELFKKSSYEAKTGVKLYRLLFRLRNRRNQADYDIEGIAIELGNARLRITEAEKIIEYLDKLLDVDNSQLFEDVKTSIASWAKNRPLR